MLPSPPALRHDGHLDSATAAPAIGPLVATCRVLPGYGDKFNTVFLRVSRLPVRCCSAALGAFLIGFRKRTGPEQVLCPVRRSPRHNQAEEAS